MITLKPGPNVTCWPNFDPNLSFSHYCWFPSSPLSLFNILFIFPGNLLNSPRCRLQKIRGIIVDKFAIIQNIPSTLDTSMYSSRVVDPYKKILMFRIIQYPVPSFRKTKSGSELFRIRIRSHQVPQPWLLCKPIIRRFRPGKISKSGRTLVYIL